MGEPVGLTAALYAARATLRTVIVDKHPHVGALGMTDRDEDDERSGVFAIGDGNRKGI